MTASSSAMLLQGKILKNDQGQKDQESRKRIAHKNGEHGKSISCI
jgi:hypothetical protein